ncbi:MAG: HD domain-containing protein [Pirellulales bacterium]
MTFLNQLPEIAALTTGAGVIRIPPGLDVPVTGRVRSLIDTAEFRRLAHISQLGLVSLVYPAANHTRFEHALGVYRLALLVLQRLAHDDRFSETIGPQDAEHLLVAALLHDLGHWPFCHPIEDIQLPGVPRHEMYANSFLLEGEIADVLRDEWRIQPRDVVTLLSEKPRDPAARILQSVLSGPIDIDKMDYLDRDSLHAGVPYGRHFDQNRLINSLCLNAAGDGLAITEKGKTAAEMMVFARYVMFSEVYWHHTVRSATAMLQRAFYDLYGSLELESLFRQTERQMIAEMEQAAVNTGAEELLAGLFGPTRRLYKRLIQYSFLEQREIYERLARRPYPWLVACAELFAQRLSTRLGRVVAPHEILFDAPPMEREVEFKVDVYYLKERRYRPLEEVSPVVRTLAREQFDDYVKRVRVFVHPRLHAELAERADLTALLIDAIDQTGD